MTPESLGDLSLRAFDKIVKAFKDRKGKDRKVGEICGGSHNIYMCRQRQHMTETAEK